MNSCKTTEMKDEKTIKKSILGPAVDTFMFAVDWTKNRQIIVYHRLHAGREYLKINKFNRHKTKHHWYPARYFLIPFSLAEQVGKAIIAVSQGERGSMPEWYPAFEKQYHEWQKKRGSSKAQKE